MSDEQQPTAMTRADAAMAKSENVQAWELVQRQANAYAASDIVPEMFRGKVANCIIALEMANRLGATPLVVMQNMYIVHGKPSWASTFLIASINTSGRFSPLQYQITDGGEKKVGGKTFRDLVCVAWARDKQTGERIESPPVSIAMAHAEGWATKNGSKWQTMPELMLRYRAATFFARLYAPEVTLGLRTQEEAEDMAPVRAEARHEPTFTRQEPDWDAVAESVAVEPERAPGEEG